MTATRHRGVLDRSDLRPDCNRCVGYCCVALPFAASNDFAFTKPADEACPHLTPDSRCRIHSELSAKGFRACVAYECFGAGQRVAQVTFRGRDWRGRTAAEAAAMFSTFRTVERLAGFVWYLREAGALARAPRLAGLVKRMCALTEEMMTGSPAAIRTIDVQEHHGAVGRLLRAISAESRRGYKNRFERSGADLAGADLRHRDLRGADLRGACLIGADLTGVDLTLTDLLGADMRDAKVIDANLSGAIFLTQPQLQSAAGSAGTRIPEWADRPASWR